MNEYDDFNDEGMEELEEIYDSEGNVAELNCGYKKDEVIECDDQEDPSESEEIMNEELLIRKFRTELQKIEPYRKSFSIVYKGGFKKCIPIKELKPGRFIVLIDGNLKAINVKDVI